MRSTILRSYFKPAFGKALTGLTALVLMGFAGTAHGANLVTNPGFETGDFTGYTVTGALASVDSGVGHTGNYAGSFGEIPPAFDTLSQTLSTQAGVQYNLSFFAQTPEFGQSSSGQPNTLRVFFGGVQVSPTINVPDNAAYEQFSYLVTATSNSSVLEFMLNNQFDYTQLDDISVTQVTASTVPEPSSIVSLATGLLSSGLMLNVRRRRLAA